MIYNLFFISLLLIWCSSDTIKVEPAVRPRLELPTKPEFDCSEIRWYYISEKLAIDVTDFKLLLKCEVANKYYIKNLENQIAYYTSDEITRDIAPTTNKDSK